VKNPIAARDELGRALVSSLSNYPNLEGPLTR
jgi:hypothetical protein